MEIIELYKIQDSRLNDDLGHTGHADLFKVFWAIIYIFRGYR